MSLWILVILSGLILISMSMLYLISRVTDLSLPHAVIKSTKGSSRALAVIFSGPGGWIHFDHGLAELLADEGFDVLGIDYLRYFFWKKRTPAQVAEDLTKMVNEWSLQETDGSEKKIALIGYAKGADVLPFVTNLLNPEIRQRIQLVTLISVSRLADFRLRLNEVLKGGYGPFALKVGPEIKKLENIPGLCVYGNQDRVSLCRNLKGISNTMEVKEIQGGRVFHDSKAVAEIILSKFAKEEANRAETEKAIDLTVAANIQAAQVDVSTSKEEAIASNRNNNHRPQNLRESHP